MRRLRRSRSYSRAEDRRRLPKTWPGTEPMPPLPVISLPIRKIETPEAMIEDLKNLKTDYEDLNHAMSANLEREKAKILQLRKAFKDDNNELKMMLEQKAGQSSRLKALIEMRGEVQEDDEQMIVVEEESTASPPSAKLASSSSSPTAVVELKDYGSLRDHIRFKNEVHFLQDIIRQFYDDYKINKTSLIAGDQKFTCFDRMELRKEYHKRVREICENLSHLVDGHLQQIKQKTDPEVFASLESNIQSFKRDQIKQYLGSIGATTMSSEDEKTDKRATKNERRPQVENLENKQDAPDYSTLPVQMRIKLSNRNATFRNRRSFSLPDLPALVHDHQEPVRQQPYPSPPETIVEVLPGSPVMEQRPWTHKLDFLCNCNVI